MSGRVFLTLLLGIMASAALTWWLAFAERQRALGQLRDHRAIERAEQMILALDAITADKRERYLALAEQPGLQARFIAAKEFVALQGAQRDSEFIHALNAHLGGKFAIIGLPVKPRECAAPVKASAFASLFAPPLRVVCEAMLVRLNDQSGLRLTIFPPRNFMPPHIDFVSNMGWFIISIAILAFFVARMTMRPLKQLAQAATDLGNDINRPPLALRGASEIRQACAAFNAMQARIRQNITQRTQMLAAITHDLQTPLTRLRLRLEKVGDAELRDKLVDDLSAMQGLVREGLDLARSLDSAETMRPLDLDSLLDSVCSDATDAGQDVTLLTRCTISVMARPSALRRCLVNLIDNAVKYGQFAQVSLECDADLVCIRICDGGPGIPDDQLERVFEPFYRIEGSRSRETGGSGLGLTIARNIVEQHGGGLSLGNLPNGGLEVRLSLPVIAR